MRKHLPERDLRLAVGGEFRPVLRHRRVEFEPAGLDQLVGADGGDALGGGEDQLQGVAPPGPFTPRVGAAAPEVHDRAAVAINATGSADFAV